jgi:hypothetical protein
MLRPTMSHAVNAEHLTELKDEYITFLEEEARKLEVEINELKAQAPSAAKDAKVEVLNTLVGDYGLDSNHCLYPDDIEDAITTVKGIPVTELLKEEDKIYGLERAEAKLNALGSNNNV